MELTKPPATWRRRDPLATGYLAAPSGSTGCGATADSPPAPSWPACSPTPSASHRHLGRRRPHRRLRAGRGSPHVRNPPAWHAVTPAIPAIPAATGYTTLDQADETRSPARPATKGGLPGLGHRHPSPEA